MLLEPYDYSQLSPKQRENYNYQKISSVLADFGYSTVRLWDDTNGADFIAHHANGVNFYKIQLKGRTELNKKYIGKDLWIAFRDADDFYVFPHDSVLEFVLSTGRVMHDTDSWDTNGKYTFNHLSAWLEEHLKQYKIRRANHAVQPTR